MKRTRMKSIALFLSLAISEITNITSNAQTWHGNNYYWGRDSDDLDSDKQLNEMDFDYQKVMNELTYKKLCCFNVEGPDEMIETWVPIAIYKSADRAIYQVDAIESEKFYLLVADAKIKDAYQLIDGIPSLITDIRVLDEIDKDNLSFSLVQMDFIENEQIVAYINGKYMIAMTPSSMKQYKEEKQLMKIIKPNNKNNMLLDR